MTDPHNPMAPKTNTAALNSRTSQLRIALVAAFLATCAFFFFFFTSAALHGGTNIHPATPAWIEVLGAIFLLAPYAVCLFLLSTRQFKSVAAAAGVACGFFGAFLIISPKALLVMLMFLGLSDSDRGADRGLMAAALTLLLYMVVSLWIIWSAFRIGKVQWNAFGMAVGATAFYLYFGFQFLTVTAYRSQRQAEQKKAQADMDQYKPAMVARQTIVSLTACLLRNHMLHPEAGYPASLNPRPTDWGCETKFAADAVPEFTLDYAPQRDAASGRVTDFQLTAMPGKKGIRGREPLLIDSRGIVFVDYPWEMENVTAKVMVMPSDLPYSQIDALKLNIDRYTKDKSNGLAPAVLNAEAIGGLRHEMPSVEEGGARLETRDFEMLYLPPRAGDPSRFAISVLCKSYGQNCLRSYFADYDGSLHATGEPRQATADDPAPLRCENANSECEDVIWDPL